MSDSSANEEAGDAAQYLTFVCAGGEYGVDILRVQEIKGWEGVTRVPYAPPYLLGVMNLRGVIVPVIDLRLRFGLEKRGADSSTTVVVVVRVRSARGEKTAGIVVDAVSDVHAIARENMKVAPELAGAGSACVRAIATVAEKLVMLLDIDELVAQCIESDAPGLTAA